MITVWFYGLDKLEITDSINLKCVAAPDYVVIISDD